MTDKFLQGLFDTQRPIRWMARAACATAPDRTIFFPERGGSLEPAYEWCRRCPVRAECLEYALSGETNERGVWGGTSERQRRVLRQRRQRIALEAAPATTHQRSETA